MTLWEIFSLGQQPYENRSGAEVWLSPHLSSSVMTRARCGLIIILVGNNLKITSLLPHFIDSLLYQRLNTVVVVEPILPAKL